MNQSGLFASSRRTMLADLLILAAGICLLTAVLLSSVRSENDNSYLDVERHAGRMLRSGYPSDLTQDVIGCRALWKNEDAYPVLGPALAKLGIRWNLGHVSTHPPTAFLLVSPIAWMPLNHGARAWAWITVAVLMLSFYLLGCSVMRSAGLGFLCLGWPPFALALGQLTTIWLLGVCGAYRCAVKRPVLAGAMLGLASLTKMAPAVLMLIFRWRPRAAAGFMVVLVLVLGAIWFKSPHAIAEYVQVVRHTVPQQSGRPDNGSFVGQLHHRFGKIGLLAAAGFLLLVLITNRHAVIAGNLGGWATLAYLAVASLPILWVYSLVPLLFLGRWASRAGLAPFVFFWAFIAMTTVLKTWNSPHILAGAVIGLGTGLILSGMNGRSLTAVKASST